MLENLSFYLKFCKFVDIIGMAEVFWKWQSIFHNGQQTELMNEISNELWNQSQIENQGHDQKKTAKATEDCASLYDVTNKHSKWFSRKLQKYAINYSALIKANSNLNSNVLKF